MSGYLNLVTTFATRCPNVKACEGMTVRPDRSAIERRCAAAADLLGWCGDLACDVDLLGDRVDVVYTWDAARHRRRRDAGVPALAEPWLLRCIDVEHPWVLDEPAPVAIVGIMARRAGWRPARRVAAGFSAFGPVAALLSDSVSTDERLDADRLGIGLVVGDGRPRLLVPPAPYVAPDWTLVQRLMQETVYSVVCSRHPQPVG